MERAQNFLLGKKFALKSDHKPLEFLFNLRKELPSVTLSRILGWAIKIMAFDFDIIYVKENTIPHVDALSRQRFQSENGEEHENLEDRIIQWVETDILSCKTLSRETQQDPILSGMERNMKIWRIELYNGWRQTYYLAKYSAEKPNKTLY